MSKHKLPEYIKSTAHKCDYGCGEEAHYKLGNNKWCCSDRYHKCPVKRKIQSIAQKKRKDLIKQGKRLGKSNRGKKHTFETKQKWSEIQKRLARHPEESKRRRQQQLDYHARMNKAKKTSYGLKRRRTINKIKKTYHLLSKVEELRYKPGFEKERIIQGHCKNHHCKNSKEKGGWFDLDSRQIEQRGYVLKLGLDGGYFYCSEYCKQTCDLYGKSVKQLMSNNEYKDITHSSEYQLFRKIVLERENYKCQYCGQEAIFVHHEKPKKTHPHLQLDPDNGVACCFECHKKYGHKKGTTCSTGYLSKLICKETILEF